MRTGYRRIRRGTASPAPVGYNLRILEFDAKTNSLLHEQEIKNRVVLTGLNGIRDALFSGSVPPLSRFALGTGSAPVLDSDTALAGEIWRDIFTAKAKAQASIVIRYYLTPSNQNGQILREAGLFLADNSLYARTVFNDFITKTSAIAVLFVWTLTWEAKT